MKSILIGLLAFFAMNFIFEMAPMVFEPARQESQVVLAIDANKKDALINKENDVCLIVSVVGLVMLVIGIFAIGKFVTTNDYMYSIITTIWFFLVFWGIILALHP
ncbi:MAG: hypothetical protein AAB397_02730 [Patescibacteria group bacterium]